MCWASCFDSWARLLALAEARGDERRSTRLTRRGFFAAASMPMVAAACARPLPLPSGPTRDMLEATMSFDLHSHPGLFPSTASDTLAGHRRSAEVGLVKVIALTATSDAPVIRRSRHRPGPRGRPEGHPPAPARRAVHLHVAPDGSAANLERGGWYAGRPAL